MTLRSPAPAATSAPMLNRAISHVRDVWGTSGPYRMIPLDELARATGVSTAHLSRAFRERYQVPPAAALERLRLARAAFLLREGTEPLAAVGAWCGFADQYHFSHRFSTVCGVPPGTYRRLPAAAAFRDPVAGVGLAQLATALLPTSVVEQPGGTPAPPPIQPGQSFAQTFTVPPAMVINGVRLHLATWYSSDSAVTVRLSRLDRDGGDQLVLERRLSAMIDNAAEWLSFPVQGAGRYRLELSDAVGTPTWRWHQGADVAPVGGTAEVDGVAIANTNFVFSATIAG